MGTNAIASGRRPGGIVPPFGHIPTVPVGATPTGNGQPASAKPSDVKPADVPFPFLPGDSSTIIDVAFSLLLNQAINNTVNISNNIDDAINSAITHTADSVASAFSNIAGTITDGLKSYVSGLGDFVNSAFGSLGDTLGAAVSNIGTVLGNLLGDVFNGLKDAVTGLGSFLGDIAGAIREQIVALVQSIQENGAQAILPLLNLLVTAIQDIRGVIAAFDGDIKGGIQSLLLLPIQLKDSLGSLEAAIQRALQEIGFKPGAKINSDVVFGDAPLPGAFSSSFQETIARIGGTSQVDDIFQGIASLVDSCAKGTVFRGGITLQTWIKTAPWPIGPMIEGFFRLATAFIEAGGLYKKQWDLALEETERLCPIKKLDPTDAIQADLRGIISDSALKDELNVQGFADSRITVLKQLALQRLSVGDLITALFRGDMSANDVHSGFLALGFTEKQIPIIEAGAQTLPTVNDVLRWKDHKAIDDETTRGLLKVLRYTPEFIDKIFQTYQASESMQEEILTHGRKEASGLGFLASTFGAVTPPEVLTAAEREQVTPGNARDAWISHWALPSYLTIIQSYFRNLRTLDSVQNVMRCENIPEEFWDELVQIQRPLIPFRSMGTLVNDGIMSEADAILELSKHGFDPLHIKWLTDLFKKQKKTVNNAALTGINALAVNTAKTLFAEGVITEEQYIQVLVAHKYDPAVAKLQADAEALNAHAKQRKVQIETYVEDVLLGLMTVDDALAKLHQGGFTANEILTFQTKVRKQSKATEKHPSIAEMRTFIKAGIIDLVQFKNELLLQGWVDPWLTAWLQLETPPALPPVTP